MLLLVSAERREEGALWQVSNLPAFKSPRRCACTVRRSTLQCEMPPLVAYESSSDDEKGPSATVRSLPVNGPKEQPQALESAKSEDASGDTKPNSLNGETQQSRDPLGEKKPPQGPALGPQLSAEENTVGFADDSGGEASSRDQSPETASRRLMQNLTLPPVPHIDIPPSPPGTPDPAAETRIKHFLKLKSQGVHMNETLSSKPALRNPSMFGTLMDFAGIGEKEQFASSLPSELQVGGPGGFDESQYVESLELDLAKSKQTSRENRTKVDFAPQSQSQQAAGSKRPRPP